MGWERCYTSQLERAWAWGQGSVVHHASVVLGDGYDHRCDIWSYGSLLYELTHQSFPFSRELLDEDGQPLPIDQWTAVVMDLTVQNQRPVINAKTTPSKMVDLIQDCWSGHPAKRPCIAQIIKRLDDMKNDYHS